MALSHQWIHSVPRNQLWLVLFNINLFYFFSKERYQSVPAHPCLLKAAPLLLTYHSLNQKGRRKQLGFTFSSFFFSFSTQMSTSSRMFGIAEFSHVHNVQSQLDQKRLQAAHCWNGGRKGNWGFLWSVNECRGHRHMCIYTEDMLSRQGSSGDVYPAAWRFLYLHLWNSSHILFPFLLLLLSPAKDFFFSFVATPSHGHV